MALNVVINQNDIPNIVVRLGETRFAKVYKDVEIFFKLMSLLYQLRAVVWGQHLSLGHLFNYWSSFECTSMTIISSYSGNNSINHHFY